MACWDLIICTGWPSSLFQTSSWHRCESCVTQHQINVNGRFGTSCLVTLILLYLDWLCKLTCDRKANTRRGLEKRFCKQFSESTPCLLGQQGSCSTTVELSENSLQRLSSKSRPILVYIYRLILDRISKWRIFPILLILFCISLGLRNSLQETL